jgi:S-adenosylmethionine:tRNA ribosyltransferase-isomerase
MHPKELAIGDYTYTLPDEKIAAFPLTNRDFSKLLICKDGVVSQDTYQHIAAYLPEKSLLIFNNTRVIQARILFQKSTGGVIEIFCLEPYEDINEYATIMNKKEKVCWKCMIGGAGKWKDGFLVKKSLINSLELKARLIKKLPDAYVVEFEWQPAEASFAEVMAEMGDIPLPPYIKRKPDTADKERYQTIYAAFDGSVAAPTAGLHFTESVFKSFKIKNIEVAYVTLHVGAGTFKPVKANKMEQHTMHAEWMDVSTATIKQLVENIDNTIAAVGTTSLRTIESLYWMGVKTLLFAEITMETISISQWEVYEAPLATADFSAVVALQSLLGWMEENKLEHIIIQTQILIAPGYQFKIARAIITNFHQPQSTLLLLVAAAIGKNWKKVYDFALENDFRFLSYGDGSLLFISPSSEREHH